MTNDPFYQEVNYEKLNNSIKCETNPEKLQNLRKCSGYYTVFNNGRWNRYDFINGRFHQFGSNYDEFDSGPGNYTTAIVELEDGQLVEAIVSSIKFER